MKIYMDNYEQLPQDEVIGFIPEMKSDYDTLILIRVNVKDSKLIHKDGKILKLTMSINSLLSKLS